MTNQMNSIERIAAAIDLRIPDRVPVDLHNFQPAAKAMGTSMAEVFQDGELLAESMLLAWREFGHDMILLENGTACNAQACGAQIVYRDDAAPPWPAHCWNGWRTWTSSRCPTRTPPSP